MSEIKYEIPPRELAEYGIEFFSVPHLPGLTAQLHFHPALEFLYIAEGRMLVEIERRHRVTADVGDLVLVHSNAIHTIANIGDGVGMYYVLKMSPSFLFSVFFKEDMVHMLPFFNIRNDDITHIPAAHMPLALGQIWRSMIGEYETKRPSYWSMQRHLACISLLISARYFMEHRFSTETAFPNVNEQAVRLISESIDYINSHYAQPLTAEECAGMVHLSYSHYAKLFRAIVGKTFKEYLTDYRMAIAYNLLLASSLTGAEIARRCGYENHTNFIVAFKKIYACTPGDIRKKGKGDGEGGVE